VIEKVGRVAVFVPSLTLIAMPVSVPTSALCGTPLSWPVVAEKVAHAGLPVIVKVSVPPLGSVVVGVNEYVDPTWIDDGGVPEIVGGEAAWVVTVSEKLGRLAEFVPSLTAITMPAVVPASVLAGVPLSMPVVVEKLAHDGLLVIENVSVPPLGFVVVGVNEYAEPACTEVPGVPEIVGPLAVAVTVIAKLGMLAEFVPSLTEITMPEVVPTSPLAGVPVSAPVDVENAAQLGLLAIENVSAPPLGSVVVGVNE